jgi:hypothetical protein
MVWNDNPLSIGWLKDVLKYNNNKINGYVFKHHTDSERSLIETPVSWKMVYGNHMRVGQCPYRQYIDPKTLPGKA